jgi:uncharacterized protein YegL
VNIPFSQTVSGQRDVTEDDVPFALEFANNPEQRCPVVLLLDTSTSMSGDRIDALNEGLQALQRDLQIDSVASKRVEIATITFGPVNVVHDFIGADSFIAPRLVADGSTPMGAAVHVGMELLAERKRLYKAAGVKYYRPWIILIGDGAPDHDDPWQGAAAAARAGEVDKAFAFYAVAVDGADRDLMSAFCPPNRPAKSLKGLSFRELFIWLSSSLSGVAKSQPGALVALPSADGWAAHG